jgi:hypothetical protein
MTQSNGNGDGASNAGRKRKTPSAADSEGLRRKEDEKRRRLARDAEEAREKEELKCLANEAKDKESAYVFPPTSCPPMRTKVGPLYDTAARLAASCRPTDPKERERREGKERRRQEQLQAQEKRVVRALVSR